MQFDLQITELPQHVDLYICVCGTEDCKGGHYFGPIERNFYLIHYILDGEGIFECNNNTYHLKKGDAFVIFPNVITYYKASEENPWVYSWIGFNGSKASEYLHQAGLSIDNPVFNDNNNPVIFECFSKMLETSQLHKGKELKLLGLTYQLLSELVEMYSQSSYAGAISSDSTDYVNQAIDYIKSNYQNPINVSMIAEFINIDRSYLGVLFKKRYQMAPKDYLTFYRMEKATLFLKHTKNSVSSIARDVGYSDYVTFSKTFKRVMGLNPRAYRKIHTTL